MNRTLILSITTLALLLTWILWPSPTSSPDIPQAITTHTDTSTHLHDTNKGAPPKRTQIKSPEDSSKKFLPKRFIQAEAKLGNDPNDPTQLSEEAELLRDMNLPEKTALHHLHTLLDSMRGIANQGYYDTGENVDITNTLLGKNYRKIAYLPDNHPRITRYGELADKWGTPYFFHFLSSKNVEIQSAGPDKEMHTDDDILHNPTS
ncbi:hypothetical protein ACFPK9_07405 [Rubritalea spongiae]|uniref:Type II secretion system protein GspG C-terminal domain-containing protein n=1 Tax=Rubritalea spongiae TaxID=430797 RepID=A0ABW5E338_9BACT